MSLASRRGTKASMCAPSRIENRGSRIAHASPRLDSPRLATPRAAGGAGSISSANPTQPRSLGSRNRQIAADPCGREPREPIRVRCATLTEGKMTPEETNVVGGQRMRGLLRNRVSSPLEGDVDVLKLVACESEAGYRFLDWC